MEHLPGLGTSGLGSGGRSAAGRRARGAIELLNPSFSNRARARARARAPSAERESAERERRARAPSREGGPRAGRMREADAPSTIDVTPCHDKRDFSLDPGESTHAGRGVLSAERVRPALAGATRRTRSRRTQAVRGGGGGGGSGYSCEYVEVPGESRCEADVIP